MLFKNSGQTPAYRVVSWAGIEVIPVSEESRKLVIPTLVDQYFNTLGAGGIFSKAFWFERALTDDEKANIAAATWAIYLFGRIEYQDVFNKKHFTNFRLRYTNAKFPPVPGAVFNFSEAGNDAN